MSLAIHESVIVLQQVFNEHRLAFPEVPKRHFGSPGYSTLLLHSVLDRILRSMSDQVANRRMCLATIWWFRTLESASLCHHPTAIIALNRTIRDGVSYVNCLTPIPEEWLIERDWYIVNEL